MKRREFITLLGGAAAAWPITARAQQPERMPVIGFLNSQAPEERPHLLAAFRKGLSETGYFEGRNVAIEYRWARNRFDRLPDMVEELVRRSVSVIVGSGGDNAGLAAKETTKTIPIVSTIGGDPVKLGFVASINRPGGNVTGVSLFAGLLAAKRLEFLRELTPKATTVALLVNPNNPNAGLDTTEFRESARTIGLQVVVVAASNESELGPAFLDIAKNGAQALVVATDPFFTGQRERLVMQAARHALPASYALREFVDAGGLMSYGANRSDVYRQIGVYTGRILKGDKPSDLPVMQPTKFELVISRKIASALNLVVPPTLLVAADEVIE
jgi:putative ABC transport system substrate-binding protein